MKLRLRSVETKETIRVDVPPSSTLPELKRRISQALPSSSASTLRPSDSIRLSLNNKDELQSSSPDETLQVLGITSGDLIFFTLNPNVPESSKPQIAPSLGYNLPVESTEKSYSIDLNEMAPELSYNLPVESTKKSDSIEPGEKAPELLHPGEEEEVEFMEVDWEKYDADRKSFSVPGFLRRVFTEELIDDDGGRDHKLLLIAIHAVLFESGFVRFDPILREKVSGYQSPNKWILTEPQGSIIHYTLPEIADGVTHQNSKVVPTVELKFQTLGKFVIVYGSLCGSSFLKSVRLNEDQLVPFLNVAWSNCGLCEEMVGEDGLSWTSPEKEVFKFWRTVKDGLALPLLIDLCEKVGFELPPCFMRLPTELKLKILVLLPGVDLAKMSCVNSELQYLASSDELWKQKFEEYFVSADRSGKWGNWKHKFANAWETCKPRKKAAYISRFFDHPKPQVPYYMQHLIPDQNRLYQPQPFDHFRTPIPDQNRLVPPFDNFRTPIRVIRHLPRHLRELKNRDFA